MRQPDPRRWHARRFTLAARPDWDRPLTRTLDALLKRMAPPLPNAPDGPPDDMGDDTGGEPLGPLAPPELRAEAPGPDGVRHGLVAFYRDLIARGELDTPDRFARAKERLFDTIR